MHPALHLDEIRTAIGHFLNPSSRVAAACCCQEWHDSFIHLNWHTLGRNSRSPRLDQLEQNKHRIQRLFLEGCEASPYLYLKGYSSLSYVSLADNLPYMFWNKRQDWSLWTTFIWNHRATLLHLNVTSVYENMCPEFCAAIAACTRLRILKLQGSLVRRDHGAAFWSACLTIEELQLRKMVLPRWNDTFVGVSRLQRLTIIEPLEGANCLDLLSHCPELQFLSWHDSKQTHFPAAQFGTALLMGSWPQLEGLDLTVDENLIDDHLSWIVEGMKRLTTLRLIYGDFGARSMQAIGKHASTVRSLDLSKSFDVTSPIIQMILSSMSALELLSVGQINYMDIVSGQPWVARNLRELCLNIDMQTLISDENDDWGSASSNEETQASEEELFRTHQRLVFDQLASLTRLRILKFVPPTGRSLDLRLKHGLGALQSLILLESFSFQGAQQQMGVEEIEWILKSWPRLQIISGRLNSAPEQYYSLKRILNEHHIRTFD